MYVPILKGKAAEFGALKDLDEGIRGQLTPLVELVAIPWDHQADRPAKSLDEHITGFDERLSECWGGEGRPIFLDGRWVDDERTGSGEHPLIPLTNRCEAAGVAVVPVLGLEMAAEATAAARAHHEEHERGVCIRVTADDFDGTGDALPRILTAVGLGPGDADVIMDLGALDSASPVQAFHAARGLLGELPALSSWRTVTIAATRFPESMSEIAPGVSSLPRTEWAMWERLRSSQPTRLPSFGDYAIAHPVLSDIDPRIMRMSANLRYTTDEEWLVLKGRDVRRHGHDQMRKICRHLVDRAEYAGPDFSVGDRWILDCAEGRTKGPGNATTWRRVATDHHLTQVVTQIANLPAT